LLQRGFSYFVTVGPFVSVWESRFEVVEGEVILIEEGFVALCSEDDDINEL
jgi:hypothetical protein